MPKRIPWETISQEERDLGHNHVAGLAGVTRPAARAAHKRLMEGHFPGGGSHHVPTGLKPTDSPAAVARESGVSTGTARKWLAAVGRPRTGKGRPRSVSAGHGPPLQAATGRRRLSSVTTPAVE